MPNAKDEFIAMMKTLGMEVEVMTLSDLEKMLLEHEQTAQAPTILSKTELTQKVIEGKTRECFDHTLFGSFDITEMRFLSPSLAALGRIERITTLTKPLAAHVRRDRDYEQARVDNLPPESLNDPILGVQMPDGECILIDGSHRVLRRQQENLVTVKMYLWPLRLADELGRIKPGWGKLPGVDWGDPDYFSKKHGENHDE